MDSNYKVKMSKTEFKEGYNFKEMDFLLLFMHCLKQDGVNDFIDKEIVDRLYPYKYDEKYKELFSDIYPSRYDQELNLWNGISEIKAWAYVNWWSNNTNRLIIATPDDWYKYIESTYSSKYIALMQQLIAEYLLRSNMEKKGRSKLNIYGIDPNKDYSLITGHYNGEGVEELIITDGTLTKNNYVERNADDIIYIKDPREEVAGIGLTQTTSRYITVVNASFVVEQTKMECGSSKSKLYTKIMNQEQLELLAEYGTRYYLPDYDETLTTERPSVYSLKNPNKFVY